MRYKETNKLRLIQKVRHSNELRTVLTHNDRGERVDGMGPRLRLRLRPGWVVVWA